jgi:sterol desaturase/sphingolipid hydroxylase (fatty acid hydroxylase superfamily)
LISHGNISLPRPLEHLMRRVLITPDLHRVHHSADPRDHSRNFGQSLTLWDRAFGTLLESPAAGLDQIKTGVPGIDGEQSLRLGYVLLRPFRGTNGSAANTTRPQGGIEEVGVNVRDPNR